MSPCGQPLQVNCEDVLCDYYEMAAMMDLWGKTRSSLSNYLDIFFLYAECEVGDQNRNYLRWEDAGCDKLHPPNL